MTNVVDSCETCSQSYDYNKEERRKHRRRCTFTVVEVRYRLRARPGSKGKVTLHREADGHFHCLFCDKSYNDAECIRVSGHLFIYFMFEFSDVVRIRLMPKNANPP